MKYIIITLLFYSTIANSQIQEEYMTFDIAIKDTTRTIINLEGEYKPEFIFKIKTKNNFSEALKSIKSNQNKFLIAVYDDYNPKNIDFYLKFIANYVIETQRHMYYGFESEFDIYEFCFVKNDDTIFFNNFSNNKKPIISFYNSTGECLYYLERSIEKEKYFYRWDELHRDLINANKLVTVDKIFIADNPSIKELKSAFLTANDIFYWETEEYDAENKEIIVFNYYNYLDEAKQGYKLKANREIVLNKWKKTIEILDKESSIDIKIVDLILSELSRSGFTKKLFNESNKLLREDDFFALDYIYKNFNEILNYTTELSYSSSKSNNYIYQIMNPLDDCINKDNNPSSEVKNKAIEYYKKFINLYKEDTSIERYYINSLSRTNEFNEFIFNYENYFNRFVNDKNLIVNLNKYYNNEIKSNHDLDWEEYKRDFTNLANTAANFVLLNSKNKEDFKKAIYWIESSLSLDENNFENYDTLSKLHYLNGNQEKAILSSTKSIDCAKKDNVDEEITERLKETQKKIKNKTY